MNILSSFVLLLAVSSISAFSMQGLENNTLKQQQFREAGNFSRVTNGHAAKPDQFRYIVGIFINGTGWGGECAGSLIHREYVLTAAHCTIYANAISISLGKVSILRPYVIIHMPNSAIKEHENYNRTTKRHDIALIKIPRPFYNVHVIPLPSNTGNHQSYAGLNGFIAGWGTTSDSEPNKPSPTLQYAKLPIIANFQCRQLVNERYMYNGKMCTAAPNKTSGCQGDSGGPLVLERGNFLIGIFSIGTKKCENGAPNLFTRVDHYLVWIHDNMRRMDKLLLGG